MSTFNLNIYILFARNRANIQILTSRKKSGRCWRQRCRRSKKSINKPCTTKCAFPSNEMVHLRGHTRLHEEVCNQDTMAQTNFAFLCRVPNKISSYLQNQSTYIQFLWSRKDSAKLFCVTLKQCWQHLITRKFKNVTKSLGAPVIF